MREIDEIIIHCSATPPHMDIGAKEIDTWHKERGWKGIGYHTVIRRTGRVEDGRPIEEQGAHAMGHNEKSIGICLIGGVDKDLKPDCNYTRQQYLMLWSVIVYYRTKYPRAKVLGHRDLEGVTKACPCFNVVEWYEGGFKNGF